MIFIVRSPTTEKKLPTKSTPTPLLTNSLRYIKLAQNLKKYEFLRDYHFPDLILLLPPGTDLHLSPVITSDMAVIQDKVVGAPFLSNVLISFLGKLCAILGSSGRP